MRVFRDSQDHWWASFVVDIAAAPLPATGKVIGIDWGVKDTAITTNSAFNLLHSQQGVTASAGLRRYERQMARRRRPRGASISNGSRRSRNKVSRQRAAVARRRQDDRRKWAVGIARSFDQIGVEDFAPKFLAKSRMARKAPMAPSRRRKRNLFGRQPKPDVTFDLSTRDSPLWTAQNAVREPSIKWSFPNATTPARSAEHECHATSTLRRIWSSGLVSTRLVSMASDSKTRTVVEQPEPEISQL